MVKIILVIFSIWCLIGLIAFAWSIYKAPIIEMKTYYFRLFQCGDEDGDTIFVTAASWPQAEEMVFQDYHSIDRLDRLYCK